MALCKYCNEPIDWGFIADDDGEAKWTPLIPIGVEAKVEHVFVDSNGFYRAKHNLVCVNVYREPVKLLKLETPVTP